MNDTRLSIITYTFHRYMIRFFRSLLCSGSFLYELILCMFPSLLNHQPISPEIWKVQVPIKMEAVEGDWEVYTHPGFLGNRFTIKEGTTVYTPDREGWMKTNFNHPSYRYPESARLICDYSTSKFILFYFYFYFYFILF